MKLCGFEVGLQRPLFLIAGPCVVESRQLQIDVAGKLKEVTGKLGVPFIFKSSYDKANRSSGKSFRGLGMDEGLQILSEVRKQVGVPVLTDVHTSEEVKPVAAQGEGRAIVRAPFEFPVLRGDRHWGTERGLFSSF